MSAINSLKIRSLVIKKMSSVLLEIDELIVNSGQIATIIGTSGSGKSTLLRWILGEKLADFSAHGELWMGNQRLDKKPIEQRGIGLMYQKGDLFPHLNVLENLLFALPRTNPKTRVMAAKEALEAIKLTDKMNSMPSELSGGEQSRVALIRSLLAEPKAILLDEPFSALDTQTRGEIRDWTFKQIEDRGIPAILVTHDSNDHGDGPLIELGVKHA